MIRLSAKTLSQHASLQVHVPVVEGTLIFDDVSSAPLRNSWWWQSWQTLLATFMANDGRREQSVRVFTSTQVARLGYAHICQVLFFRSNRKAPLAPSYIRFQTPA